MTSTHWSAPSLAGEASAIGWNLIEATSDKNVVLFNKTIEDLRRLLNRIDEIRFFFRERPDENTIDLDAGKPIRRLLANRPPEEHSKLLMRLDPPTQHLHALMAQPYPADDFPTLNIVSQLKTQVATLTGHLSKADI